MGAINPLFMLAGAAVAVPLFLHLFQRQESRRLAFPALRYLERTEREHARRIRFRQLLLLLLRLAVLILLVGAGARLFVRGRGSAHPPTAVVIILDNSMSSGLVVGERRVLDELRELALTTLEAAGPEDRLWVLRPGAPWVAAVPGGAAEARAMVEATEVRSGRGDLTAALSRAAELLRTSTLERREIHLLSDLQATAFTGGSRPPAGNLPVVVWHGEAGDVTNRALTSVLVGGGLAPLQGQRSEATVSSMAVEGDTVVVPIRLVLGGRIRGAATLPAGAATPVPLPPAGSGWVRGYAESDPDALRADDRRYFAFHSRPPPRVALTGEAGVFVEQAVAVLDSAARLERVTEERADLLIAAGGSGIDRLGPSGNALVVPPSDPALLPALNRRLAEAGIPWTYQARPSTGGTVLIGTAAPALDAVPVAAWFRLALADDPPAPTRTLVEAAGDPWAVEGADRLGRRYLLVASPMDVESTSLPLSTAMLQFVDWAASQWAGSASRGSAALAGEPIPAPNGATHVRMPDGEVLDVDGTRTVTRTGDAGFYDFLAADTVVTVVALNTPPEESDLTPLAARSAATAIGDGVVFADDTGAWASRIYRTRQGPEVWWPFVAAAAVLLLLEALVASSGRRGPVHPGRTPRAATDAV